MGDLGSFAVQSQELRQEGKEWQTRKQAVVDAEGLADNGAGKGYMFGFLANVAGIGDQHDEFITAITGALTNGVKTFDYMSAALISAANAYDGVDATVAESADQLKGRLPR